MDLKVEPQRSFGDADNHGLSVADLDLEAVQGGVFLSNQKDDVAIKVPNNCTEDHQDYQNRKRKKALDKMDDLVAEAEVRALSHEAKAENAKWKYFTFGFLPIALLSASCSIVTQLEISSQRKDFVVLVLNCISGLSAGIAAYWNWGKLTEQHVQASKAYHAAKSMIQQKFDLCYGLHIINEIDATRVWNQIQTIEKELGLVKADAPSLGEMDQKSMAKRKTLPNSHLRDMKLTDEQTYYLTKTKVDELKEECNSGNLSHPCTSPRSTSVGIHSCAFDNFFPSTAKAKSADEQASYLTKAKVDEPKEDYKSGNPSHVSATPRSDGFVSHSSPFVSFFPGSTKRKSLDNLHYEEEPKVADEKWSAMRITPEVPSPQCKREIKAAM